MSFNLNQRINKNIPGRVIFKRVKLGRIALPLSTACATYTSLQSPSSVVAKTPTGNCGGSRTDLNISLLTVIRSSIMEKIGYWVPEKKRKKLNFGELAALFR